MGDNMIKYAVFYAVYFTVAWSNTLNKYGSAVMFISLWHGQLHEKTENSPALPYYGSAGEFSAFRPGVRRPLADARLVS